MLMPEKIVRRKSLDDRILSNHQNILPTAAVGGAFPQYRILRYSPPAVLMDHTTVRAHYSDGPVMLLGFQGYDVSVHSDIIRENSLRP